MTLWLPTLANAQSLQDKWLTLYPIELAIVSYLQFLRRVNPYPKALLQESGRYWSSTEFSWGGTSPH
ncbi:DUF3404 domain-containing protein [Vibrio lentus]|nr:DUF3404 domain-containing protein [Vibrio lentus]